GLASEHRGETAAGQLDQHLDVEANLVELALDGQAVEAAGGPEARVVDEPVDGEPAARHLLDQLARRFGPQQVLHDDVSPHPMRIPELAREGLQPLGAPRDQHDMPAVARDAAGGRLAAAARGAGDERDPLRHGITSAWALGGPA